MQPIAFSCPASFQKCLGSLISAGELVFTDSILDQWNSFGDSTDSNITFHFRFFCMVLLLSDLISIYLKVVS